MEVKARQVYTRQVFSLFKEMVQDNTLGEYLEVKRGVSYKVNMFEYPEISNYVLESYIVEVDKERCKVSYDGKGYIISGILYSRAIKIMQHVGITDLPDHYILKRWTKRANASAKRSINERSMDSGELAELLTLRKASLKSDWMELTDLGAASAIIASGKHKLLSVLDKQAQGGCLPSFEASFKEGSVNDQIHANHIYHDPEESHCKGRKKGPARFVPPSLKKRRTCSICGEKEGHNSRTCPTLKNNGKGKRKAVAELAEIYESEEEDL